MNLLEQKAAQYAKSLRTQAVKNEPQITEDLQKIASEVSAEMVGLEHKFKTEDSLTRKLVNRAAKIFEYELKQEFSEARAVRATFLELVEEQNDVLRYTFVLPFEKYIFGFRNSLEKLKRKDYEIPEDKIWNAWKNIGTSFDKGYRGINITIISSQKQIFELQCTHRRKFSVENENSRTLQRNANDGNFPIPKN